MNRAAVNAEATVVSSLTVTVFGNCGSQQRHQRDGLVGAFVRRGLRRAAFGDEIKHAVFRRVFDIQFERAIAVGLALGQLRGRALARGVKGHRRSGDGTAGALDGHGDGVLLASAGASAGATKLNFPVAATKLSTAPATSTASTCTFTFLNMRISLLPR